MIAPAFTAPVARKKIRWWHHLSGGRPMQCQVRNCFTDVVSGKSVGRYIDAFGNPWLATGPWSLFRVAPHYGAEIWDRD